MKNNEISSDFKGHIASMVSGALTDVKKTHPEYSMCSKHFGSISKRITGMLIGRVLREIRDTLKDEDLYKQQESEIRRLKAKNKNLRKIVLYWKESYVA